MTYWTNPTLTIGATEYNTVLTDRDTLPTAYAPAAVAWSQPTGLDNPGAATFTVDVTVPVGGTWPALRDAVEFTADHASLTSNVLFAGAVDGLRRLRRELRLPDGTTFEADVVRVQAIDWLGILARRKIGDEPWPLETAWQRVQRFVALMADLPWEEVPAEASPLSAVTVAPRDVDNAAALDVLLATIRGADYVLTVGTGLRIIARLDPAPDLLVIHEATGLPEIRPGETLAPGAVQLPASVIVDAPRILDWDGIVNRASYTHKIEDPDNPGEYIDTTVTYTDDASIVDAGESTYAWTTDAIDPGTLDRLARWAVLNASRPRWRLDGDRDVLLSELEGVVGPAFNAVPLLASTAWRGGAVLTVTDAPESDLQAVRVIGGQVVIGSDEDEALSLTTEPHALASGGGLTFADVFTTGSVDDPPVPSAPVTFDEIGTLTFADMVSLSGPVLREDP